MSAIANKRMFLEAAHAIVKAREPDQEMVAELIQSLEAMLNDMFDAPCVVNLTEKEPS